MGAGSTAMELGSVHDPSRPVAIVVSALEEPPLSAELHKERPRRDSNSIAAETKAHQRSWLMGLINRLRGRSGVVAQKSNRVIPISPSRTTPLIQPETGKPFVSNSVTTARYTIWDFLPKQLYAQFSKIANVYFLFVASLQMVPSWSPTGQYTTLVPLLVFLSIAIAHEGYDDYRRHRQDNGENNQTSNVFRRYRNATNSISSQDYPQQSLTHQPASSNPNDGASDLNLSSAPTELSITIPLTPTTHAPIPTLPVFQKIKWRDIAVGDIVRVDQNDWVPADLILLHSAGADGGCYVETAALDGETNLKQRQTLKITNDSIRTPQDIATFTGKNDVNDVSINALRAFFEGVL